MRAHRTERLSKQAVALAVGLALATSSAAPKEPAKEPAKEAPKEAPPKDAPKESAKEAPPPPPPVKVDPKVFEEALEAYFAGKPKEAAPKLYAYLEGVSQTEENYPWAQYFLAQSLIDLKLRHAGVYYLSRVAKERANPAALTKALEALQAQGNFPHDERMVDEQTFGTLDVAFLPDAVSAYAHYHQGLIDLRLGHEKWAETHFAKLAQDTPEASKARFAVLVSRLKTSKRELPKEMIQQFLELSEDEKLSREARNESLMAVARLRYELKDYRGALDAYSKVVLPPLDPGRATLYLEEAWTRFQLGEVHAAMGILTTLDAPSFRDEFLPDKYILRAFVFKELCHYLPAKRAAKELTRRYADSLEAIHERQDLTADPRLRRAAASHGTTQRAERFLLSLDREGEQLGRYAGSFGERLFGHLTKLYDLARAEAERSFQQQLAESVREEADKLLRAAEQVRLMEYEVGLKLYERVKRGSKLVIAPEESALTPSQVGYRFDGEYWNDELRDYRFSLKSRCIEETAQ